MEEETGGEEREEGGRKEKGSKSMPSAPSDSTCPWLGPGTLRQTVQLSVLTGPSHVSMLPTLRLQKRLNY